MKKKNHSIEFVFVLILFSLFIVMCVILINFGSSVYKNISDSQELNNEKRTTLSYVVNKIRSSSLEMVSIDEKNGTKVLVIDNEGTSSEYQTIIFCNDGYLKEATIMKGDEYTLDFGSNLLKIDGFDIEIAGNLVTFKLTDKYNDEYTVSVRVNDMN